MSNRERRVLRVIERRVQPVGGAMTVLARRREELRLRFMSWIRRVVVVGLVAANARRWQRGVVVVDVAIRARTRRNRMRARQRERCVVVIEGRVRPVNCVMAELAGRREASVRHRTVRIVEIGLVARNAQCAVQVVVIVDVAIRASPWRNRMGTRQWESGLRVVKLGIRPLHGVMTLFAGLREARMRHGTVRIGEIGLVAADAGSRQRGVVVVHVAVHARSWRHGV